MKPLTKTTVNRGGGIAARFAFDDTSFSAFSGAPPPKPKAKKKPAKVANAKPVANKPVANVANPKPRDRVTRWREANPELYRKRQAKYQADYRKRRAADKAKEKG